MKMPMTIGQKSVRVLYLMRGLNNPRIAAPLTRHGFTQADLEEGWRLLMEATGAKLNVSRVAPDPTLFEKLDAWENLWFPIVSAALSRHYPEVGEAMFLNLTQTMGVDVAVSVGTLARRIRETQANGGEVEQEAMALLARRGLTEEVLSQAEALLGQLRTEPDPEFEEPIDRSAAEEAMWAWYLEWSTIARQIITDRNQLRSLGFLRRSSGGSDQDLEAELEDVPPTEPARPVTVQPEAA
jgi:hypothetical protein